MGIYYHPHGYGAYQAGYSATAENCAANAPSLAADACYEGLLKIGGTSAQEPTQKPGDPDRRGELKIPPAIRGGSQRNYREGQSLLRAKSRTAYESRAAFIGAVDGQASSIDNDVINHARAP
jgi:hypothetical protein